MFGKLKSLFKSVTMFARFHQIDRKLDELCNDVMSYKQTILSLKPSKFEATFQYDVSRYLLVYHLHDMGVGVRRTEVGPC